MQNSNSGNSKQLNDLTAPDDLIDWIFTHSDEVLGTVKTPAFRLPTGKILLLTDITESHCDAVVLDLHPLTGIPLTARALPTPSEYGTTLDRSATARACALMEILMTPLAFIMPKGDSNFSITNMMSITSGQRQLVLFNTPMQSYAAVIAVKRNVMTISISDNAGVRSNLVVEEIDSSRLRYMAAGYISESNVEMWLDLKRSALPVSYVDRFIYAIEKMYDHGNVYGTTSALSDTIVKVK